MPDFYGASIEDLQLAPAISLSRSTTVADALRIAYERDFTIIPICAAHDHARGLPVGYLDIEALTMRMKLNNYEFEEMQLSLGELMEREGGGGGGGGKEVKRFDLKSNYQVITPDTTLEILFDFLEKHSFALITDHERRFVMGLATKEDLDKFILRRNPNQSKLT